MAARILIIEDNPASLDLMTYLVGAFGHTPLSTHDGEEGLEVALREVPDLIICDVQIPKRDGFEVARQLKSHPVLRTTPLIAVTALAMVGDRERMLGAGFDGYISKPIDPETFVEQIGAFLRPDLGQARPKPAHPMSPAMTTAPPGKRATILAVDDSPENLGVLRSILEPFGYTLIAADNVVEALALARRDTPDLIVCDVHIHRESGYDLVRAVKADPQLCPIPMILLTSTAWKRDDRRLGLDLGVDRFIVRPIEPRALLAEIEACLGGG